MSTEEIQKFIETNNLSEKKRLKITFKKRDAISGFFVHCKDAIDLESKNFWRIVTSRHSTEWDKTKNLNLSRIFNGSEFSKITIEK